MIMDLIDYFKKAESEDLIDQSEGKFRYGKKCCFGAHLAHALDKGDYYDQGEKAFYEMIGKKFPEFNRCHLQLILKSLKMAPFDIFGKKVWNILPSELLAKLQDIEDIPRLSCADLTGLGLRHALLLNSNFNHSKLRLLDLFKARLSGSSLTHADLTGVSLEYASLDKCDLSYANLSGSYSDNTIFDYVKMRHTDLTKSRIRTSTFLGKPDLSYACFKEAEIFWVNFSDCDLTGADFTDSSLEDVFFSEEKHSEVKLSEHQLKGVKFI